MLKISTTMFNLLSFIVHPETIASSRLEELAMTAAVENFSTRLPSFSKQGIEE